MHNPSLHHEPLLSAQTSPFLLPVLTHGSRYTWPLLAPKKCQEPFLSFAFVFPLLLTLLTMPSLHFVWFYFFGPIEPNAGRPPSRKSFLALSPLCTQCECQSSLRATSPSLTSPLSLLEWVICWAAAPTRQQGLREHCSILHVHICLLGLPAGKKARKYLLNYEYIK